MATVLVLEDDESSREMLADYLSDNGHTVVTAAAGQEGMLVASAHRPLVVLLDLGLPGIWTAGKSLGGSEEQPFNSRRRDTSTIPPSGPHARPGASTCSSNHSISTPFSRPSARSM